MKIKPTRTGIAFFVALLAGLFALSQFSPIGMLIYAVYAVVLPRDDGHLIKSG